MTDPRCPTSILPSPARSMLAVADPAAVGWIFDAARRAQRLSHSSAAAVGALILGNLIPLVGVLLLGWQVGLVLGALLARERHRRRSSTASRWPWPRGTGRPAAHLKADPDPVLHAPLRPLLVRARRLRWRHRHDRLGVRPSSAGGFGLGCRGGGSAGHPRGRGRPRRRPRRLVLGQLHRQRRIPDRDRGAADARRRMAGWSCSTWPSSAAASSSPSSARRPAPIIVLVLGKTLLDLNYHLRDREKAAARLDPGG